MNVDIDQLRNDLRLTAAREGWLEAETKEVGAAIKAAIDAGDEEVLATWARDLSWWRELLSGYAPRLRSFEVSIKGAPRVAG